MCTLRYNLMLEGKIPSHHSTPPHLFVTGSGEGHLEVMEPGRPDSIEPVDHLLEKQ